jgi:hypothetical protein
VALSIAFNGFRDGVLDIFHVPIASQTDSNMNRLTVFLLSLLTITAVSATDLGLINAVAGGALATCVCIIFPTFMFREAVERSRKFEQDREVSIATVLMIVGTTLGIVGVLRSCNDNELKEMEPNGPVADERSDARFGNATIVYIDPFDARPQADPSRAISTIEFTITGYSSVNCTRPLRDNHRTPSQEEESFLPPWCGQLRVMMMMVVIKGENRVIFAR